LLRVAVQAAEVAQQTKQPAVAVVQVDLKHQQISQ
jgi:hypothetical protein